ncbi:SDR family NAD(P)-dependent oxidoreductase [Streptomyces pseudogriseolus]|uniref:SDR family oxidoreductase n=2 Tax=Streptomyces TaxID=1883 RepID=A0AB39NLI6_9ACTN|nr:MULTISPECIES: SDR family oxidoreductase [Streptomyces]MCI4143906.1 SDR family oxidoreductase [Streptomyces sp. MMS20-AI2-20]GGQ18215.1 short-chain dehydrogenase [Streptomyces gancidicus]GGS36826.1 short-chain dehydrogenase [Streptomyces rubiginosus]
MTDDARRVLVTGGTRGIGRATALAFARSGARLVVAHRGDGRAADRLTRELDELGADFTLVAADLTEPAGADRLAEAVRLRFGGLDVLVNNLGVDGHVPFEKLTEDEWHRVLGHNTTSAYLVTRAVLDLLGEGASIVTIGASVALRGRPLGVHYSASKAALVGFTRSLAKELGDRRIRVNLVAPGVTRDEDDDLPPQLAARLTALTALGRLGRPEDVAGAVLYLAGDSAAYVTGTTIEVDGGI